MKKLAAIGCLFAIGISCSWAGFVYENQMEFYTTGDFDGDSYEDVVLLDKETGYYRIGYGLAEGTDFQWSAVRSSGLEQVGSFAVGKLQGDSYDELIVSSLEANRIDRVAANDREAAGIPSSIFVDTLGISTLVATDVASVGSTGQDDLVVGSVWNSPPQPLQLSYIYEDVDDTYKTASTMGLVNPAFAGNALLLTKSSTTHHIALLLRDGSISKLQVYKASAVDPSMVAESSGALSPQTSYVYGFFNDTELGHFLFYETGATNLLVQPLQENPAASGVYEIGSQTEFTFVRNIYQIFTLPGGAEADKLLVLFDEGRSASIWSFDGINPPELLQDLSTPVGYSRFTGAGILTDGRFALYSGVTGEGPSQYATLYKQEGGAYSAVSGAKLSRVYPGAAPITVITLDKKLFTEHNPKTLRTFRTGQWSSGISALPGTGNIQADVETYRGVQEGLGDVQTKILDPMLPEETYGLINQYKDHIAVYPYRSDTGSREVTVSISPPPGSYSQALIISFLPPDRTVYYRMSDMDAWMLFTNAFYLNKNKTITYYAQEGVSKSPIKTATYHFPIHPHAIDSDGDGVPDFIEQLNDLDPFGGRDSDKDGFTDLEELLQGTNPLDASEGNYPEEHVLNQQNGVDILQTLRPYNGFTSNAIYSATGVVVQVDDALGATHGLSLTHYNQKPGLADPSATFIDLMIDAFRKIVTVSTPYYYDVIGSDIRLGRELVALRALPAEITPSIDYTSEGLDDVSEAQRWFEAASNAYINVPTRAIQGELDMYDTLVTVLFESKIGRILKTRGETDSVLVSMIPSRPLDVECIQITQDQWVGLENRYEAEAGGVSDNGYVLTNILTEIDHIVRNTTDPSIRKLLELTEAIYSISSRLNNEPPYKFRLPLDVLRDFVGEAIVDQNYLDELDMTYDELTQALQGAHLIMGVFEDRPVQTHILKITETTLSEPCTLLASLENQVVGVVDSVGRPYNLTTVFELVSGVMLEVTGYTDHQDAACNDEYVLEYIDARIIHIPNAPETDEDANLLPDAWERFFFGETGQDPFADADADGFSNLYEYLHGMNPTIADAPGEIPDWWIARGVIDNAQPVEDFNVANLGQLKHIAYQAYQEMTNQFEVGAGNELDELVQPFFDTTDNDQVLTVGQLKYVASKFYDRLIEVGAYDGIYPWTATLEDDDDFSLATIGQLKFVFSFVIPAITQPEENEEVTDTGSSEATDDGASDAGSGIPPLTLNIPEDSATTSTTDTIIDTDGDGISDQDEINLYGTNPYQADTDHDGIADGYEIANQMNALVADADGDVDGDGISNWQEYQQDGRTPASNSTPPLTTTYTDAGDAPITTTASVVEADVDFKTYITLDGKDGINRQGLWYDHETAAIAERGRGIIEYPIIIDQGDKLLLEIDGQSDGEEELETFHLRIYIDDVYLGRFELVSTNAQPSLISTLLPWLEAGKHTVRLLWDDTPQSSDVQITAIRIKESWSPDYDENGIKNWVEEILPAHNGMIKAPAISYVSPTCIEGRVRFMESMTAIGGLMPQHGIGDQWYLNMPLAADRLTPVWVMYEDLLIEECAIQWKPTNLLLAEDMKLRLGDALLLTAHPENQEASIFEIQINGPDGNGEVLSNEEGEPIIWAFEQAGVYTITGSYTSDTGEEINNTIQVTVVATSFNQNPAVLVGEPRTWDAPNLASQAVIESDDAITLTHTGNLPEGGKRFELGTTNPDPSYIIARLGEDGPILANARVDGFHLYSSMDTYLEVLSVYPDESQLIELGLIMTPTLPDVEARLTIFVGGVIFADGSTRLSLYQEDFGALGFYPVRFIKPKTATSSVCHITETYQNNQFIGIVEDEE